MKIKITNYDAWSLDTSATLTMKPPDVELMYALLGSTSKEVLRWYGVKKKQIKKVRKALKIHTYGDNNVVSKIKLKGIYKNDDNYYNC